MPRTNGSYRLLSERLRQAYEARDLEALGALLADDVRWGDDDHPNRCRDRSAVLATLARGIDQGIDGEITDLLQGREGILCGFDIWGRDGVQRSRNQRRLYHVYVVKDGRILEIQQFDDRASAAEVAGIVD